MGLCYDNDSKRFDYCASNLPTYIALGVIVPLGIILIIVLVYIFLRCRQRQIRRQEQQTYMATIIPIYNSQEGHPAPYTYSYPPHYTPRSDGALDKPPSYEQTIQETVETDTPAILPVTPTTRNQP